LQLPLYTHEGCTVTGIHFHILTADINYFPQSLKYGTLQNVGPAATAKNRKGNYSKIKWQGKLSTKKSRNKRSSHRCAAQFQFLHIFCRYTSQITSINGVAFRGEWCGNVVERRSGKYFGAGTALRQISLATGGKTTTKRSGKSRCTRSVDPRSVYFLAQIAPKRGIWHHKSQKIIRGCQREEASPSRAHPQHGYTPWPCTGAQAPSLLGPRSRKPFPQIKIYHYTPGGILHKMSNWQMKK